MQRRNEEANYKPLPVEGEALRELYYEGNGKDAELHFIRHDGELFRFGVSEARLRILTLGSVLTEVIALDDITQRVRYSAAGRLVLRSAQIRYPGRPEQWESDRDKFAKGDLMSWALSDVRLTVQGED